MGHRVMYHNGQFLSLLALAFLAALKHRLPVTTRRQQPEGMVHSYLIQDYHPLLTFADTHTTSHLLHIL